MLTSMDLVQAKEKLDKSKFVIKLPWSPRFLCTVTLSQSLCIRTAWDEKDSSGGGEIMRTLEAKENTSWSTEEIGLNTGKF